MQQKQTNRELRCHLLGDRKGDEAKPQTSTITKVQSSLSLGSFFSLQQLMTIWHPSLVTSVCLHLRLRLCFPLCSCFRFWFCCCFCFCRCCSWYFSSCFFLVPDNASAKEEGAIVVEALGNRRETRENEAREEKTKEKKQREERSME